MMHLLTCCSLLLLTASTVFADFTGQVVHVLDGRGKRCQEQFFLSLAAGLVAQEIVDDLEYALEQFRLIANDLGSDTSEKVT
jgi:hypothetical protein